jgi:hypothetical protein
MARAKKSVKNTDLAKQAKPTSQKSVESSKKNIKIGQKKRKNMKGKARPLVSFKKYIFNVLRDVSVL